MRTPGKVAQIFIDGRALHIKRLVGKPKQRTYVPYEYHYKKSVGYQRTVPAPFQKRRTVPAYPT